MATEAVVVAVSSASSMEIIIADSRARCATLYSAKSSSQVYCPHAACGLDEPMSSPHAACGLGDL